MSREDHDQILLMANGDIILNTESNGVMFITESKRKKDNEPLKFADFQAVINQSDR